MSKLRIGVVVYNETHPSEGGGHAYYDALLKGINDFEFDSKIEIFNIVLYSRQIPDYHFRKPTIPIKLGLGTDLKALIRKVTGFAADTVRKRNNIFYRAFRRTVNPTHNRSLKKLLEKNKIDLLYYMKPERGIFEYPFIATNWDVAHRSIPAFPEISAKLIYNDRENYFLYTLSKAFIILCESNTGAKELKNFYPLCEQKVRVLPMFAGNVINLQVSTDKQKQLLDKYDLWNCRFFIYPAQFWPLKNHYNLLIAFKKLITELNIADIKLVFAGSDKGNKDYIIETINDLQLEKQVILTGFVPEEEIYTFYKNAIALTMPTFLGPTNLPLLEAAQLGCPVICSDLEGHRELLKETALYVNPSDSCSIANAMKAMLDSQVRERFIATAKERVLQSPFRIEESLKHLNDILLDILPIRKAWGFDYDVTS
jgi:glycosyltransferase involved in cell wall biosynthesis